MNKINITVSLIICVLVAIGALVITNNTSRNSTEITETASVQHPPEVNTETARSPSRIILENRNSNKNEREDVDEIEKQLKQNMDSKLFKMAKRMYQKQKNIAISELKDLLGITGKEAEKLVKLEMRYKAREKDDQYYAKMAEILNTEQQDTYADHIDKKDKQEREAVAYQMLARTQRSISNLSDNQKDQLMEAFYTIDVNSDREDSNNQDNLDTTSVIKSTIPYIEEVQAKSLELVTPILNEEQLDEYKQLQEKELSQTKSFISIFEPSE